MVDTCWRCQLRLLYKFCGISYSGALRPLLVSLVAWQRTSPRSTRWAAVLECVCGAAISQPQSNQTRPLATLLFAALAE